MSVICLDTFRNNRTIKHIVIETIVTQTSLAEEWESMKDSLNARFGPHQPKNGIVVKQPLTKYKNEYWLDTYGRGCVHNSIWEPFRTSLKRRSIYNRPMPFPCDFYAIEKILKRYEGKTLNLGLKSDPFMWMDSKYGHTKRVLMLAQKYNVSFIIHTMSDLIAHSDYIDLLKGHSVVMNLGSGVDQDERENSPGAPSVTRRQKAVEVLREFGIKVDTIVMKQKRTA